jgi:hypothetical protein
MHRTGLFARRGLLAIIGGLLILAPLATTASAQEEPAPPVPYLGDADLNHDVVLDRLDFLLFVQYWRTFQATGVVTPAISGADFNKDGKIDLADARHMIEQWILYGPRATTSAAK